MKAPLAPAFAALLVWLLAAFSVQAASKLRGARLFKSGPVQITQDGAHLWAVNPDHDSVTRLDTATEAVSEFKLSGGVKHAPKGLSVTENGAEVWVACHDSDLVLVLDGQSGAEIAKIELPWGSGPYSIAISPDQRRALVTLHRAEAAAVLDTGSKMISTILDHLFWAPMGIAWAESGRAAWITHIFAPGEHPLQTRIDFSGEEPQVSTAIRITPADPRQRQGLAAPYNIPEGGYLNVRGHPAQIPAVTGRNELWLPTQYHNFNTDFYSPDSTMQSAIRHINLATRKLLNDNTDKVVLSARYVHRSVGSGPYEGPGWDAQVAGPVDIAFSADGRTTYLLHELSRDLVIMPSDTPAVKPSAAPPLIEITVGDRPIGFAVSPSQPRAYVLNLLSRDISVIDLERKSELKRIPATPLTAEPFSKPVLQGAKIFHSSDDPRISVNAKVACASCHINAEHDGRTWSFQNLPGSHGPRPVPSLLGLRLSFGPAATNGWGQLHRSGDRDEIQDFEHTFQNIQMGGTGFLATNASPELGSPNAGKSPELDALAAYLLSLDPLPRSPFRAPGGALSEAAVRGATFFLGNDPARKRGDAGCAQCHVPETGFVDFAFHDVGQRRDPTERELNSRTPAWSVNTATLLGLWTTPPYGGIAQFAEGHSALGSMVSFLLDSAGRARSATPHGRPDRLSKRQLRDLAEFVLSIDGNITPEELRAARDTSPPRIIKALPASLSRIDVWFNETVSESTVERPEAWRLIDSRGNPVPISAAVWDPQNGDRVQLTAPLRPHHAYTLQALSSILDDAGAASGGAGNLLDPAHPDNTRSLLLTDRLTITLGSSGYENLTIPVHDAAMVGPGLATWSHDSIWLAPTAENPRSTTGFLRFGWQNAFRELAAATGSQGILAASFSLQPEFGDSQPVELRRVLQRWSDPATGGDWNNNPTGAPTWRNAAHGGKAWNAAGAARLGSNGDAAADYFGSNDLASRIDATARMNSVTRRTEFAGPLVTEAFRFWLDNPALDYGYALRLRSTASQDLKFDRHETGLKDHGAVLTITYLLPGASPAIQARSTGSELRLEWPATPAGWVLQSTANLAQQWNDLPAPTQTTAGLHWVQLPTSPAEQFFRLRRE